jgi:polyhydroxyalkanoate synthesis regulator phasin
MAVVAVAAAALTIGAGSAVAARPHTGPLQAAAAYLDVTVAELRVQLRNGKSLAQVATAEGKSVEGLKAAILADAKARLDRRVARGGLTEEQAAKALEHLESRLDQIVNRTGPVVRRPAQRLLALASVRITAAYTGLTVPQVREQLRAGKSLAQIAESEGKSVDGLKQRILDRAKAMIDRRVAAGRMSAERGQRLYEAFAGRIDRLLSRARPAK